MSNTSNQRAVGKLNILYGDLSLPVKVYVSAAVVKTDIKILDKKTKQPIRQLRVSANGEPVIETTRGVECGQDLYLEFSTDDLNEIVEIDNAIYIKAALKPSEISPMQIMRCYYLWPDTGAKRSYSLLNDCLNRSYTGLLGQWMTRGRERFVLIRSHCGNCLIMQELYYPDEVRQPPKAERYNFKTQERRKVISAVSKLETGDSLCEYTDGYRKRLEELIELKNQENQ